jgi:hypothetical protein
MDNRQPSSPSNIGGQSLENSGFELEVSIDETEAIHISTEQAEKDQ